MGPAWHGFAAVMVASLLPRGQCRRQRSLFRSMSTWYDLWPKRREAGNAGPAVGGAMILVPGGVRIWIAIGYTDMHRLAMQVRQCLDRDPHAGDLNIFRDQ